MTPETRTYISMLLTGEDPDVRRRAAEELASTSGLAPITALAGALEDDDKGVRDAAARSLLAIGGIHVARAIVEYIVGTNIITRNLVAELLVKISNIAIPAVVPYLDHKDRDVRKFAVDILGLIGSDEPAARMLSLLDDPDENVVVSTVEALGNMKSAASVRALYATYDRFDYTRPAVAESLGKIGASDAEKFLILRLHQSLSTLAEDPVTPFVIVEALGLLGGSEALGALQESQSLVKGTLRSASLHAIVRISEHLGQPIPASIEVKADYQAAIRDNDVAVRVSAVKGLSGYAGEDVTEMLVRALGVSPEVDAVAVPALLHRDDTLSVSTALIDQLPPGQRKAVIGLLRRVTMETIQHVMRKAITTGDEKIFDRAFTAIAEQWNVADEETRAAIVDALFRLDGDRAVQFLDAIMNDPDPWLRIHVIEVIAAIADPRAPEFIARFLQDDDETVREVAMGVLQNKGYDVTPQTQGA
jgi:HEAT repeat protein